MALVHKIDAIGLALAIVFQEVVARCLHKTFKGLDLQLQHRAFKHIPFAVNAHVATGLGLVAGLVVFKAVGLDYGACLAQDHVAFNDGFQIWAAGHAVALHKNRKFSGLLLRQLFLQLAGGSKLQWFFGRLTWPRFGRLRAQRTRGAGQAHQHHQLGQHKGGA